MSIVARPPGTLPDAGARRKPPEPSAPPTPAHFRRRRLALAGGALGATLAIAAALVLILGGSGEAPPATGAAAVVPADALAYVNLSTDPGRPAVKRAQTLASRFPDWRLLQSLALGRLSSLVAGAGSADLATKIRPWLGDEAALALVPAAAGGAPEPLLVLDVAHSARARSFVAGAGATPAGAYRGVRLLAYSSGSELAFVSHYLVAGSDAGVRAAIDADSGRARSLQREAVYERAAAGEPAGRVLDAYLPAAGVRRLLAARTGVAGAIGLLLDRPSLQGTAISLSAESNGARVEIHGAQRPGARPGPSFTPTLQSVLPTGSTLMVDVDGLNRAGPQLLAATATAGIGASIGPLLGRLGAALTGEGVNVHKVLSLFSGETAVAMSPGPTPALLIVSRVRSEATANAELASLEGPVSALFSSSGSDAVQVPELADRQIGGATVRELQLGPGLQVDYAVFNGLVVVSTSVAALDGVAERSRALGDDAAYKATVSDRPAQLSSLVFADVGRLLALGEQTGLTSGARTRELLPDLSKVRAIGVSSSGTGPDTTTELSLQIP